FQSRREWRASSHCLPLAYGLRAEPEPGMEREPRGPGPGKSSGGGCAHGRLCTLSGEIRPSASRGRASSVFRPGRQSRDGLLRRQRFELLLFHGVKLRHFGPMVFAGAEPNAIKSFVPAGGDLGGACESAEDNAFE